MFDFLLAVVLTGIVYVMLFAIRNNRNRKTGGR